MRLTGDTKKGQSILEYAILISVMCAVFLTMTIYMQRSVQAKFLTVQNQVNEAAR